MSVGLILKQLRKSKNISQKEVSQILNLSLSSIYRFENGGQISYYNYLKYCKYLGIGPYVPIIICSNDKMLLLYNKICQTILDKEMFEAVLIILVQALNQGIEEQIEKLFYELDEKISDDFIKMI